MNNVKRQFDRWKQVFTFIRAVVDNLCPVNSLSLYIYMER